MAGCKSISPATYGGPQGEEEVSSTRAAHSPQRAYSYRGAARPRTQGPEVAPRALPRHGPREPPRRLRCAPSCGLTLRSRADPPRQGALAAQPSMFIIGRAAKAPCLCGPLSSNVRPQNRHLLLLRSSASQPRCRLAERPHRRPHSSALTVSQPRSRIDSRFVIRQGGWLRGNRPTHAWQPSSGGRS